MIEIIELIGTLIPLLYLQGCLGDDDDDDDGGPFEIRTKNELLNIGSDKNYKLMNNIDFEGETINPLLPYGYIGTFDGNGFEIRNFIIDLPSYSGFASKNVGLFGLLGGTIKLLGISGNCSISGGRNIGGLVGYNGGTIENCYNVMTGDITGWDKIGGLVGRNHDGTIKNCYNGMNGDIINIDYLSLGGYAGGLVGGNYSIIINCYNAMTGNITGLNGIGGIVGINYDGTIENCYNTMNGYIFGNEHRIGNFVGQNQAELSNCYNDISPFPVEGFVGNNWDGNISNCYDVINGWQDSDAFNGSDEALTNINNVWYNFDGDNNPYGLTVFTESPWVGYKSSDSKPYLE